MPASQSVKEVAALEILVSSSDLRLRKIYNFVLVEEFNINI
jgi:hypothetical protein